MPKIEQEDRTAAEAWGKVEPDTTQKTDAFAAGYATAREKYQKLLAEERAHADMLAKALAKRLEGDVPPCGWCSYNCGRALLDDKRCCKNCSTCAALTDHRQRREGEE